MLEKRKTNVVRKEFSAGAVVYYVHPKTRKREYLILHYTAGHWDLPKGHIEGKETIHDTVRREVEEETGIKKINIQEGFNKKIRYYFNDTRSERARTIKRLKGRVIPKVYKTVTFVAARARTHKVKLSHEHKGYVWLPYRAARKKITFAKARSILEGVHAYLQQRKTNG